jgi:tetratricopeptide (TPR) repeat protein
MDEAKFHTLHAYIHRRLADSPDATASQRSNWREFSANNLRVAFRCDPLEYWGVVEDAFREGAEASEAIACAGKNRGLKAQQLLECICDYFGIGAWDEIVALCDAALARAAVEKPYETEGALPLKETIAVCDSYKNAMFGYFKAYAQAKLGMGAEMINDTLSAAGTMTTDYCFPSRLEELEVLQWAAKGERSYKTKEQRANTHYYLGSILWNMDQKTPALASWKIAVKLNPRHALALRCVGFAVSHPGTYFTNTGVPSGIPSREAYDWYVKSLEAEPHFRTLDEAGKLAERLELPAAERLALMEKYMDTVNKYDPCILRLAYTYNAVGRYSEAYKILTTRRFHVWEGADGLLAPFIEACHGLGRAAHTAGCDLPDGAREEATLVRQGQARANVTVINAEIAAVLLCIHKYSPFRKVYSFQL